MTNLTEDEKRKRAVQLIYELIQLDIKLGQVVNVWINISTSLTEQSESEFRQE